MLRKNVSHLTGTDVRRLLSVPNETPLSVSSDIEKEKVRPYFPVINDLMEMDAFLYKLLPDYNL